MRKTILYISILLLFSLISFGSVSPLSENTKSFFDAPLEANDSLKDVRFKVDKAVVESARDLRKKTSIDLKTPANIVTEVIYDYKKDRYIVQTKMGDIPLGPAVIMTTDEYVKYRVQEAMHNYYKEKNAVKDDVTAKESQAFSLTNFKIGLGEAERIFGPGGIQVSTRGSLEISAGIKRNVTDNPALSERARSRSMFDFDQKIQVNMNAKVGNKINFGVNYNTEATFDFDSKRVKLAYEGDEDEIIKHIEAGNVSMTTTNSLINGGSALFGLKTDMQFGKLRVSTILSQQESEARTVNSQGGVQTTPFEFTADMYDENRHFFLNYYFRDNYDNALKKLPFISSAVTINRIEVWVTNKRGNYDQSRNILAFSDMGEHSSIHNSEWQPKGSLDIPYNDANNLYSRLNQEFIKARDLSQVMNVIPTSIVMGQDYEKLENARLLDYSEYTLQPQLGYISLNMQLQPDEVLAVAYEYSYRGQAYQVGEFSNNVGTDNTQDSASGALFVKLIKPISLSPNSHTWHLMMKNVYQIDYSAYNIQQERFKMNIVYQSDTTGLYLNYIPAGNIDNKMLLQVMQLDRLNMKSNPNPDGIFDYIEGITVSSDKARIMFPVVEPFGKHLRDMIGNDDIADKYVYQELYDSTLTVARQTAEKNKFKMLGEYKGAGSGGGIRLGATNVTRGSVKVMAGGAILTENVDYTVDYMMGTVDVINQSILESGTPISVSLENQSMMSLQRKTLMGVNLLYDFTKDFSMGATMMHMSEKPLTTKSQIGSESVQNTLWGLNLSYRTESQALTNLIDKLPFVNAVQPSHLTLNAEFAHLIPGHYTDKYVGNYMFLDDFESSTPSIDLRFPHAWSLASTPLNNSSSSLFPEAQLSNNVEYGKNRAHLAWFTIDAIFTHRNSSLTPEHIKNDKEQLSSHFVREIYARELFPNRDATYGEISTVPVLNLSYYPQERGHYNLDLNVDSEGKLLNPEKRWGGIMRKIDTPDFESANVEYLEFWLMDPFVEEKGVSSDGGALYFNLGEVSEDVLKDGKKFFENGLPLDGDPDAVIETAWGKVPKRQSTGYNFDNSGGDAARAKQDVGLNGLSTEEEKLFAPYKEFIEGLKTKISPQAHSRMQENEHSPLNDPAGDNFRHYRGIEQDRRQMGILDRYKYYNGTEGNSRSAEGADRNISLAARTTPDVEDVDRDNTLNENESYYQYKVDLRPSKMHIGSNNIVNIREVNVELRNGQETKVKWYQFKIPIKDYNERVGNIQNFKNIRFIRMFLTDFKKETFLRFGTLELVRSDWRTYDKDLLSGGAQLGNGRLDISSVNIEENGDRKPVNYILPPGVNRNLDPGQPQLRQENEQAISMRIHDLDPRDTRAIYKNSMFDLRRFKRMQMFVHAEQMPGDVSILQSGELTVFIRLGSDYRNNYYEYEIPLRVTPEGYYSDNSSGREQVWPIENMFDFPLDHLVDIKLERNREKRRGANVSFLTPYSKYDSDKPNNKITIMGNPSLSEVKVLMIGIRNNSPSIKSGEVWVNELRMSDFDENSGWAAQTSMNLALSDLATINVMGRKETVGFGSIDQGLSSRRHDDFTSYNISMNVDLGRFLPEKAKVHVPLYYSISSQSYVPEYDPFDQDVKLSRSLEMTDSKMERDSIVNLAATRDVSRSLSLSNMKVDIRSKTPMPYDPANFSFGYSFNERTQKDPTTEYTTQKDYRAQFDYLYTPMTTPFEPFKNMKNDSKWLLMIKALNFNYLPNDIQISSSLHRNYHESQLRDMNAYLMGDTKSSPFYLSFSQNFVWNRDLSFNWDFMRNLKTSFSSGMVAEIEEPYLQVNKRLNRDDYEIWKDSVMSSIMSLGRPLTYRQTNSVTYTLPLSNLPILDWISADASFNSSYNWARGAEIEGETLGNTINNDRNLSVNADFSLTKLYDKIDFLKKINQKTRKREAESRNKSKTPEKKSSKRFSENISIGGKEPVKVAHNLNSKRLRVVAKDKQNDYPLKYKVIDDNTISIANSDSLEVKLQIVALPPREELFWYKLMSETAKTMMMVKRFKVSYNNNSRTDLPGFNPMVGNWFGQNNEGSHLYPGLGFAFGLAGGESFIEDSKRRNLLVLNESNINPAIFNYTDNLRFDATLEPIAGLRIDLNALREDNRRTEMQYMFEGMPRHYGGSFSISTICLSSAFKGVGDAKDGYKSATFNRFLENRYIVANRLRREYTNSIYPSSGFIVGHSSAGAPFDPSVADVNLNSGDVLIPSFIAAYTGGDASKRGLTAFPSLSSILPNWNVTYNALLLFPGLKDILNSFVISHKYISQYNVASYTSSLNWVGIYGGDNIGFIKDIHTNNPTPSSRFEISSVSLIENFNPLIDFRGVFKNNMSINMRMNKNRTMNLNLASFQIVETAADDYQIGFSYRMPGFSKFIKTSLMPDKRITKRKSKKKAGAVTSSSSGGSSSDLDLKVNISHKVGHTLIRKIEENFTQATSGQKATSIRFSADYSLSRSLVLRAFYDRTLNKPLVSSYSYPTANTHYGLSLRFNLVQ